MCRFMFALALIGAACLGYGFRVHESREWLAGKSGAANSNIDSSGGRRQSRDHGKPDGIDPLQALAKFFASHPQETGWQLLGRDRLSTGTGPRSMVEMALQGKLADSRGLAPSEQRMGVSMQAPAVEERVAEETELVAPQYRVRREHMNLTKRSPAEVAVGSSKKEWRKIVDEARSSLVSAVRVRHILLQTKDLADVVVAQLREGAAFEEIASMLSACKESRDEGGVVGWCGLEDEHLDYILPREARKLALGMKPGDVKIVSTNLGEHVMQVMDVFQTLAYNAQPRTKKLKTGILPRPLMELLRSSHTEALDEGDEPAIEVLPEVDAGVIEIEESPGDGAIKEWTGKRAEQLVLNYSMDSMGCQMNSADAERMEGQLRALGFRKTEKAVDAQVVVLNTCSIREHAETKVYSHLGPHAQRKRQGEDLAIIVAGCVAQQEGEELLRKIPEIDLVMGPQYANRIGDLLEGVFMGNQIVATAPTHIMEDPTQPQRQSTVAAWVNIIYGCNERCTYCVVPTTRGSEQSRQRDSIRAEIVELVAQGYKEVTLLGQNIDSWGRDLVPSQTFADLLRDVGSTPGLARMRFVTSHPRYMSKRVVEAVADTPALCEMFHIPFQSGDDDILRAMERGYTAKRFKEIVAQIRTLLPDAAITADAIVGFPGETEEQFQNTLKLMEDVKFDQINTAAYSPRPHTPAALWPNQLDEATKKDRLYRINELAKKHALERRQRYLGRVEEVLVEQRNLRRPEQVKGRNRQGCPVFFDGDIDELKGKLVPVRIIQAFEYSLLGEMTVNEIPGGRYIDDGEGEVLDMPQVEEDESVPA